MTTTPTSQDSCERTRPDFLLLTALGFTSVVALSFIAFEATAPADGVWMPSEGQMYAMLIGTPAFIAAAVCWIALGIRTIFRALRST